MSIKEYIILKLKTQGATYTFMFEYYEKQFPWVEINFQVSTQCMPGAMLVA